MRAIDRKLVRDLTRMRGQVITIALVLAAGVAASVTLTGTYRALNAARDDYYQRNGFPDLFVHLERAPDAMARRLAELPGVARVDPRLAMPLAAWMPGMARPAAGQAVSLPDESGTASLRGLVLRRGRAPDLAHSDEVLVLASFADAHGLVPGDRLDVILAGRSHRLTMVGVVLSPEHVFAISGGVVSEQAVLVLWMPRRALAARTGMGGSFNDVTFTLTRDANPAAVIAAVDHELEPWGGLGAYGRDHQLSHMFVSQELEGLEVMATRIPFVFLLVAAFLLNVVLSRLIHLQREQLAVLRALGYSRGSIARHVGAFAALIVVVGGVLGVIGGDLLGRGMTRLYVRFFHFPDLAFHLEPDLVGLAVAVCAGATLVGALRAMRRTLRMAPAEAMRPPAPARYRRGILSGLGLARIAGPLGRTIVREIERKPLAMALSVVGVGFAVAIVVIGRFSQDSLDSLLDDVMDRSMQEDVAVVLARPVAAREVGWFEHAPGVLAAEPVLAVPVRLAGPRGHRDLVITALRRGDRLRRILDGHRPVPAPSDGLLISGVLAERLGVVVGAPVLVERHDGDRRRFVLPVAGLLDDHMGLNAYIEQAALARVLGQEPQLNQVLLEIDRDQRDRLLHSLADVPAVVEVMEVSGFRDAFAAQTGESMTFFTLLVVGLGVVIAVGVVYNNARVALSERARDLATLRVLGYRRDEVAIVLLGQLAIQVVVAIPIGLIGGWALASALMATADPELYRLPVVVAPSTFGFAALVVSGAALLTAVLVRRRLDRVDLVDALKARD